MVFRHHAVFLKAARVTPDMNTAKQPVSEYGAILREIQDWMKSIEIIMTQLAEGSYVSVDSYVNNMNILADFYQDIGQYLKNPAFMIYFKQNDTNLFINILAIGRSIALMKNLLLNISHIFEGTGDISRL